MKTSGLSFYFILYLVAIITVFAITIERDRALKQRDELIAHLVSVNIQPLRLSAYVDTARFFIEPSRFTTQDSVAMRIKVEGPIVKSDVQFTLIDERIQRQGERSKEKVLHAILKNEDGDGILLSPPLEEGTYEFRVAGYKPRIMSDGRVMRLKISDTTYYSIPYSETLERVDRDTAVLIAKVEKSGIVPPQLTLSVQEANENWVLGPPFQKKVFVGGVENLEQVAFAVSAPARIEKPARYASYAAVVWDKPVLGKRSFTVTADAKRGFNEKDRASVSFNVEVMPATFVTAPSSKGFWGIPYAFDGQLFGLNPLDITVETFHDGRSLGLKPAVPKFSVTPERGWSSLLFKVFYRGVVLKEHSVTLSQPPPPQIKWVQQNLDRSKNAFLVSVTAADPVGGAVRMSLQSEPAGIARLDKISGTSFNVSVNLESKPPAVFLKLTATDQYGGQSISTKQFNIPQ
jgi:hypothetical protein